MSYFVDQITVVNTMTAREDIKTLLLNECMTITALAQKMTEFSGKKYTRNGISQKLIKGTLRYDELELICKILNYKIEYKKLPANCD